MKKLKREMMNKLKYLLIFLILGSVLSCSNEPDPLPDNDISAEITGNWSLSYYSYDGHINTIFQDSAEQEFFNGIGFEINVNNIISDGENGYSLVGSYGVEHYHTDPDGNELFYLRYVEVNKVGNWTRNGNNITINLEGEDPIYGFITELTDTTLELVLSTTSTELDANNIQTNSSLTETFTYERIQ